MCFFDCLIGSHFLKKKQFRWQNKPNNTKKANQRKINRSNASYSQLTYPSRIRPPHPPTHTHTACMLGGHHFIPNKRQHTTHCFLHLVFHKAIEPRQFSLQYINLLLSLKLYKVSIVWLYHASLNLDRIKEHFCYFCNCAITIDVSIKIFMQTSLCKHVDILELWQ